MSRNRHYASVNHPQFKSKEENPMDTRTLTGAETFLRLLASMGVERIFASPGSEWSPVWEHLAKPYAEPGAIPVYISSRHEEVALGHGERLREVERQAARGDDPHHRRQPARRDGDARRAARERADGGVRRRVDRLRPRRRAGSRRAVAGEPRRHRRAGAAARALREVELRGEHALGIPLDHSARLPARPVGAARSGVRVAADGIPVRRDADERARPQRRCRFARPLRAEGIEQLADLLAGAKTPAIVTERAGETRAAVASLVEIAQLLAAPVVESRGTKFVNFPRNHPLHAGFDVLPVIADADVVFMPGVIAPWHPASAGPAPGAKVAVLDENPLRQEKPVWGFQTDLCLFGSLDSSLAQLAGELEKAHSCRRPGARATRRALGSEEPGAQAHRGRGGARIAVEEGDRRALDRSRAQPAAAADAVLVDETITTRSMLVPVMDRLRSFYTGSVGGLGTGLGTALGVKAAYPDRTVVCTIGDGSFNYNPVTAALGLAQEHRMPILVIVCNNQGYQSQQGGIPHYYPGGYAVQVGQLLGHLDHAEPGIRGARADLRRAWRKGRIAAGGAPGARARLEGGRIGQARAARHAARADTRVTRCRSKRDVFRFVPARSGQASA